MSTEYSRSLLRVGVAQICQSLGWNSIQSTPLELMTDVLERYLLELGKSTHKYCEQLGRLQPNLDDLGLAFSHMGINLAEIEEYVKHVDPLPFHHPVIAFPAPKSNNLQFPNPASREILQHREEYVESYLPYMLPGMEDELEEESAMALSLPFSHNHDEQQTQLIDSDPQLTSVTSEDDTHTPLDVCSVTPPKVLSVSVAGTSDGSMVNTTSASISISDEMIDVMTAPVTSASVGDSGTLSILPSPMTPGDSIKSTTQSTHSVPADPSTPTGATGIATPGEFAVTEKRALSSPVESPLPFKRPRLTTSNLPEEAMHSQHRMTSVIMSPTGQLIAKHGDGCLPDSKMPPPAYHQPLIKEISERLFGRSASKDVVEKDRDSKHDKYHRIDRDRGRSHSFGKVHKKLKFKSDKFKRDKHSVMPVSKHSFSKSLKKKAKHILKARSQDINFPSILFAADGTVKEFKLAKLKDKSKFVKKDNIGNKNPVGSPQKRVDNMNRTVNTSEARVKHKGNHTTQAESVPSLSLPFVGIGSGSAHSPVCIDLADGESLPFKKDSEAVAKRDKRIQDSIDSVMRKIKKDKISSFKIKRESFEFSSVASPKSASDKLEFAERINQSIDDVVRQSLQDAIKQDSAASVSEETAQESSSVPSTPVKKKFKVKKAGEKLRTKKKLKEKAIKDRLKEEKMALLKEKELAMPVELRVFDFPADSPEQHRPLTPLHQITGTESAPTVTSSPVIVTQTLTITTAEDYDFPISKPANPGSPVMVKIEDTPKVYIDFAENPKISQDLREPSPSREPAAQLSPPTLVPAVVPPPPETPVPPVKSDVMKQPPVAEKEKPLIQPLKIDLNKDIKDKSKSKEHRKEHKEKSKERKKKNKDKSREKEKGREKHRSSAEKSWKKNKDKSREKEKGREKHRSSAEKSWTMETTPARSGLFVPKLKLKLGGASITPLKGEISTPPRPSTPASPKEPPSISRPEIPKLVIKPMPPLSQDGDQVSSKSSKSSKNKSKSKSKFISVSVPPVSPPTLSPATTLLSEASPVHKSSPRGSPYATPHPITVASDSPVPSPLACLAVRTKKLPSVSPIRGVTSPLSDRLPPSLQGEVKVESEPENHELVTSNLKRELYMELKAAQIKEEESSSAPVTPSFSSPPASPSRSTPTHSSSASPSPAPRPQSVSPTPSPNRELPATPTLQKSPTPSPLATVASATITSAPGTPIPPSVTSDIWAKAVTPPRSFISTMTATTTTTASGVPSPISPSRRLAVASPKSPAWTFGSETTTTSTMSPSRPFPPTKASLKQLPNLPGIKIEPIMPRPGFLASPPPTETLKSAPASPTSPPASPKSPDTLPKSPTVSIKSAPPSPKLEVASLKSQAASPKSPAASETSPPGSPRSRTESPDDDKTAPSSPVTPPPSSIRPQSPPYESPVTLSPTKAPRGRPRGRSRGSPRGRGRSSPRGRGRGSPRGSPRSRARGRGRGSPRGRPRKVPSVSSNSGAFEPSRDSTQSVIVETLSSKISSVSLDSEEGTENMNEDEGDSEPASPEKAAEQSSPSPSPSGGGDQKDSPVQQSKSRSQSGSTKDASISPHTSPSRPSHESSPARSEGESPSPQSPPASADYLPPPPPPSRPKAIERAVFVETVGTFIDESGQKVWICPMCKMADDGSAMIGCDKCDDWYHWPCVDITEEPPENEEWYCPKCYKAQAALKGTKTRGKRGRGRGRGKKKY